MDKPAPFWGVAFSQRHRVAHLMLPHPRHPGLWCRACAPHRDKIVNPDLCERRDKPKCRSCEKRAQRAARDAVK